MGSIRPTYIKRVALELVERYPEEFKAGFQRNKELVDELCDVKSKEMRNKIAGYASTYALRKRI